MSHEEILSLADKYNIRKVVQDALDNGATSEEILEQWDM